MPRPLEDVYRAFLESTGWDEGNQFAALTASSRALIDFDLPDGLQTHISAQHANYGLSYGFSALGPLHGTLGFAFSSLALPLDGVARHQRHAYQAVREQTSPQAAAHAREVWHRGRRVDSKDTLCYGVMYVPRSRLEAVFARRLSSTALLVLRSATEGRPNDQGTFTAQLQQDYGRWSAECLYSTNEALLGLRGLYHIWNDSARTFPKAHRKSEILGRLTAGAEAYYALGNKSGGGMVYEKDG